MFLKYTKTGGSLGGGGGGGGGEGGYHIYVCICIYIYVYIYYVYIYTYVYVYIYMYVCMYVCIAGYVYSVYRGNGNEHGSHCLGGSRAWDTIMENRRTNR